MKYRCFKLLALCLVIAQFFSLIVFISPVEVFADANVIPQAQITATASSEREESPASNVLDGNPATFWQTEWWPSPILPQHITLDLNGTYNVNALSYLPKQSYPGDNGVITGYVIYVSSDGINFTEVARGAWADNMELKRVEFPPVSASYIRLEAVEGKGNQAAASEINVEHTGETEPSPTPAQPSYGKVPQETISATATDSQGSEYGADKAIDGNLSTYWHTSWSEKTDLPHSITLDLSVSYAVYKIEYTPKYDYPGDNGVITEYRIYISSDGTDFTEVASGTWAEDASVKTVTFAPVNARYVRLEAVAGKNGYANAREINVYYGGEEPGPSPTASPTPSPVPSESPSPTPSPTPSESPSPSPLPPRGEVPHEMMSAVATDMHEGHGPENAVDNNSSTYWHTSWSDKKPLPQSITINLGGVFDVHKIRYIPKCDYPGDNGVITEYRLYLSSNGNDFTEVASGTWAADASAKTVIFEPVSAQYVKLEAVEGVNGFANAKEIKVYYGGEEPAASPTPPPEGVIGLIPLNPSMVQAEEIAFYKENRGAILGDASMLVDEQHLIGTGEEPDPYASPVTNWKPAWESDYYPASAFIDLGRNYKIDRIYLYDTYGAGDIIISYGSPFNWTEMFRDPMSEGWNSWNKHDVSDMNIVTRYIRITKTTDADMNEIAIYGTPVGPAPTPEVLTPRGPLNIPVDQAMGMNAFNDDPVDRMMATGHIREYNCWGWTIHGDSPAPGDPGQLEVAPNPWGWHFDNFYTALKEAGLTAYVCMQQSPPYIAPKGQNKPVSPGEDPEDPFSYSEHAAHMFQYAARYGSTVVDDSRLNVAPGQPRRSGMNLIEYYENWNEPNGTWGGRADYFSPYELAAMTSADYDGHEGRLGENYGIKNADPNAKLVMGGLAGSQHILDYIKLMKLWFENHRSDKKFAADVINFHYYSSTGTRGASPEESGMKDFLKTIVDYCHTYLPEQEVWLSEFGWDTKPGTPVAAPSLEVQGQWIVRGYLAGLAAGLDRITMYMLRDAVEDSSTMFDTSGLVTGKGKWEPKPSWYYTYTMKNVLKNMVFDSIVSEEGNVWIYKFRSLNLENPTFAYAVWCPTTDGTTVEGFELEIGDYDTAILTELEYGYTGGIQTVLAAEGGMVTVNVSERPIFVTVGQFPESIEISGSDSITLPYEGQTATAAYEVIFRDQNGGIMPAGGYTWTIIDEAGNPVDASIMEMDENDVLKVYTTTLQGTFKLKVVSDENPEWQAEKIITLARAASVATKIEISGPAVLGVPESGSRIYEYQAVVKNQFNEPMEEEAVDWFLLDEELQPADEYLVSVNAQGAVTVSSLAQAGTSYILKAVSRTDSSIYRTKIISLGEHAGPVPPPTPTPMPTPVPAPTPTPPQTSGSGSASGNPSKPEQLKNEIRLPAVLDADSGKAIAVLSSEEYERAVNNANIDEDGNRRVVLKVDETKGAVEYVQQLPVQAVASPETNRLIEIRTALANVILPGNMLENTELAEQAESVGISVAKADITGLSEELKQAIGNRTVLEINLSVGGETISWSNEKAPVTLEIPYEPSPEELENTEFLTIWYIDGHGNAIAVPNARYDAERGLVVFRTTHFSKYAIVMVRKTFEDISALSWAVKPIEVLASKGIIPDMQDNRFLPREAITRADFMVFLVRALGLESEFESNFDDVAEDKYYFREVGIARKLGITNGVGNNRFNPEDRITRQDMMCLMDRALTAAGKAAGNTTADLSVFLDSQDVSSYALKSVARMVGEGIIVGNGYRIYPRDNTSRAEAAVAVYRIFKSLQQ